MINIFLINQSDYIGFIVGLSFILVAFVSYELGRINKSLQLWHWFALFCLLHGIYQWLAMLVFSQGESLLFKNIRFTLLFVSFIFLFEFGFSGMNLARFINIRVLAYTFVFVFFLVVEFTKKSFLECTVVMMLGIGAGILSAYRLYGYSRGASLPRSPVSFYLIVPSMIVYFALFFIGMILDPTQFDLDFLKLNTSHALHSIEVFRTLGMLILPLVVLFVLQKQYYTHHTNAYPEIATIHSIRIVRSHVCSSMFLIIGIGWLFTEKITDQTNDIIKKDFLKQIQLIKGSIDGTRLKSLSALPSDTGIPDYRYFRTFLSSIQKAATDIRYVYLYGATEKVSINYVCSASEKPEDDSWPADTFGILTPEEISFFTTGIPTVFAPYTDLWGTWVSAVTPLLIDSSTKHVQLALGADIAAKDVDREIASKRLNIILVQILLICIVIAFLLVQQRTVESAIVVTESQKRVEKQLLAAKEAAESANSAKSEFLANMSHEIRTPLNGILGMTEIVMEMEQDEQILKLVNTINTEAENLLLILNDILDLSKIEAKKMVIEHIPFDIAYLMDTLSQSFALRAEQKELDFVCYVHPDTPHLLYGDPGRLRQILVNLVGNAIKFTREGEVTVSAEKIKENENSVTIHCKVQDTGIGIPKEKHSKIFETFTQVDSSTTRYFGGTGLGTSIAKKLVNLMGGTIGLTSEEKKGSTFWFEIPFEKQAVSEHTERHLTLQTFKGLSAAIIDDNQTNQSVLRQYLESWGFQVLCISNPMDVEQELDKFHTLHTGLINLIIIDFLINGVDGFDIANTIKSKKEYQKIPLVLLTSLGRIGDASACRECGINGYVTKPVTRHELVRVIQAVLLHESNAVHTGKPQAIITKHSIAEQSFKKCNILVADDYQTNQDIARMHLTKAGYQVFVVSDGKKAFETWQAGRFDCILMDIQMPVIDGLSATRTIRQAEAERFTQSGVKEHIPIVAITAFHFKEFLDQCYAAGMDDFVTKPLKRQKLLEVIEKWVQHTNDYDSIPVLDAQQGEQGISSSACIFNSKQALEEFGNDKNFIVDIIMQFKDYIHTQIQVMDEACIAQDFETISREAHALKGGAANLTALELAKIAGDIEQCNQKDQQEAFLLELKKAVKRFESSVEEFIKAKEVQDENTRC